MLSIKVILSASYYILDASVDKPGISIVAIRYQTSVASKYPLFISQVPIYFSSIVFYYMLVFFVLLTYFSFYLLWQDGSNPDVRKLALSYDQLTYMQVLFPTA